MSITKYLKSRPIHCLTLTFFFIFVLGGGAQAEPQNQERSKIIIDGREYFLHVVKQGEGFYALARQYNVSQQEILAANPDLKDGLKRDQVIKIPVIKGRNTSIVEIEKGDDFILHTVEPGQTVYFISRKYDVPINDIYSHNPGSKNKLVPGSIIKVPVKKTSELPEKSTQPVNDRFVMHTVQPGETLYALSKQHHISIEEIIDLNPALKSGILSSGSVVRLPKSPEHKAPESVKKAEVGVIEGEAYLYHEIKPGETLYSISRIYNVSVRDLRDANSEAESDNLNPGYMLRIPRQPEKEEVESSPKQDERLFLKHKVSRRETLFSISRQYNVDIETLKKLNPELLSSKLKRGMTLKIPKEAWFVQNASPPASEEKYSPSLEGFRDFSAQVIDDSLCANREQLGRAVPLKVALLLPFALEASRQANIITTVENGDTIRTERSDAIIANQSKVFVEFYEGALLALDSLKKQGISVDLSVYDIAPNGDALRRVLNNHALKSVDLIIGPARSDDLKLVSDFSIRHKIKLVYPLSNVNTELLKNPYLFQINTPDTLMFDRMANEIVNQASGHNLLVVLPAERDAYAEAFMEKFRKKVYFHEFALDKKINYKEYRMTRADENLNNIRALIDPLGKNFIVVPTNQEATVSEIVPVLAGVKDNMKAQISLFGMTEWLRAQSINPEDMFALNAQIFTFFALDYRSPATNGFINKYRQWYHTEPHAVSPFFQSSSATSGFSRYGIWGHDVMYYFVYAMASHGRNFEYCPSPVEVQPLQFNFSFARVSNWGGFYNQGIFLLKFNPGYSVSRVPVLLFQSVIPANPILPSGF